MTILGFVTTPNSALVWTDSEVTKATGEHSHYRSKMLVNPLAAAVCVATGWLALADEEAKGFNGARDIDDAARVLPRRLREKTMRLIGFGYDPQQAGEQAVFLIGYSPRAGRVCGYEFRGSAMFEPVLAVRGCSPLVAEFEALRILDPAALVPIARAQMQVIRTHRPDLTGGDLVAAHIADGGVSTMRVHDLARDYGVSLPPPALVEATA